VSDKQIRTGFGTFTYDRIRNINIINCSETQRQFGFLIQWRFTNLQEDQDWGIVAMVLDRLFLWVFGICALGGSLMILSDSPYIYEEFQPIDVKFSKIAEEESRMYQQVLYWSAHRCLRKSMNSGFVHRHHQQLRDEEGSEYIR